MAWTTPTARATGFLVTAAVYNAEIIANLQYLHGDGGATIDVSAGGQTFKATALSTAPASGNFGQTGLFLQAGGTIWAAGATSPTSLLVGSVSGDTERRISITAGGVLNFGSGSAATDLALSRSGVGQLLVNAKLLEALPAAAGVTVPATFTPNLTTGPVQRCNVTAGGANTLTIAAPTSPPSSTQTAFMVIRVSNTGGGLVTYAWNAAFVGGSTLALPTTVASGNKTSALFFWDGVNWQILAVG